MSDDSEKTEKKQSGLIPYKPGISGNPTGRPKGARNKLGEAFLEALHEDFKANGKAAIETCRTEKPDAYLKVIASILPKQAEIKINEYDDMDGQQLRAALNAALRDLATLGVDLTGVEVAEGVGAMGENASAVQVQTLQ